MVMTPENMRQIVGKNVPGVLDRRLGSVEQIEVTEHELDKMACRAAGRLRENARVAIADLDSQIQFADNMKSQKGEDVRTRENVFWERE